MCVKKNLTMLAGITASMACMAIYGTLIFMVNIVSVSATKTPEKSKNIQPPNHEFILHEKNFKKDKSTQNESCKLIIEPHVFKQRRRAKKIGDIATFSCNECQKHNKYLTAKAKKIGEKENEFKLVAWPSLDDHVHITHSTAHLKTKFMESMYEKIKNNPSADMPKLYEETRTEYCKNLSDEDKAAFFSNLPSMRNIQGNAYRYVRNFIPHEPKDFVTLILIHF